MHAWTVTATSIRTGQTRTIEVDADNPAEAFGNATQALTENEAPQRSQLHPLLTGLNDLSATWLTSSGKTLARANQLGNCAAGMSAATEAGTLRGCAQQLSAAITTALTASTGPGAELTPADVDALVITAAELWDPDGDGADEALSEWQREVLAKARAIHDREYDEYGDDRNWDWRYGDDPAIQDEPASPRVNLDNALYE